MLLIDPLLYPLISIFHFNNLDLMKLSLTPLENNSNCMKKYDQVSNIHFFDMQIFLEHFNYMEIIRSNPSSLEYIDIKELNVEEVINILKVTSKNYYKLIDFNLFNEDDILKILTECPSCYKYISLSMRKNINISVPLVKKGIISIKNCPTNIKKYIDNYK